MKVVLLALFALSAPALVFAGNNDGEKTEYKVNTEKSKIIWKAAKVTGKHDGTVTLKEGVVVMDGDKLSGGSFVMDMTSIAVTDLQGDMQKKLEGHLKSDDFFGVETFPTATMEIKKVKAKDDGFHVTGDLTIKGITHPVEFVAVTKNDGGTQKAMAEITIDRSKYNVRYGSNSFFDNLGDKAIYDNFDLIIELVLENSAS